MGTGPSVINKLADVCSSFQLDAKLSETGFIGVNENTEV